MNSSTFQKDNINYSIILNEDGTISFSKITHVGNTSFETGLTYGNSMITYHEFFHDENQSTDTLRQMSIKGTQYLRMGTQETFSYGNGNVGKDFYDWNKLYGLIEEFKGLENQDFNNLMNGYLNLDEKLEGMTK